MMYVLEYSSTDITTRDAVRDRDEPGQEQGREHMAQMQTQPQTRLESRDVKRHLPGFYPAVVALNDVAQGSGLEPELIELINLRASQINGCAYCVQSHTRKGRGLGIPQEKLTLVVAWEESGIFSEREQAALAWTEALTLIAETHVPDAAYDAVREVFPEQEVVGLTAAIGAINVWNRIAVTFRYAPEV
jgi:AhpD family alkylhydroperoxidase